MAEAASSAGESQVEDRNVVLRRRAAKASVSVAVTLAVAKLIGSQITGSVAVFATLIDSLSDIAAALITLVSINNALRPPDAKHRYGYGKAESLSALIQAAFVGGSGVVILLDALLRFLSPTQLTATPVGIGVMALSLVLTGGLVLYQRQVVRETGSEAINADSVNYTGDLITALAVILALVIVGETGAVWVDPLVGTAVAGILVWNAVWLARGAVDRLLDREMSEDVRDWVRAVVTAHPECAGLHDLRTRQSGYTDFIEFHLELNGQLTLDQAHEITDQIEHALKVALPGAEVTIHQEPAGLDDERLDHRIAGAGR